MRQVVPLIPYAGRGRMRTVRTALAALSAACSMAWGHTAAASTTSTVLGVSVRVVRSCAVQARALEGTAAALNLTCSSGHVSNVLVGDAQLTAPRGLVHVADTNDPASGGMRVVPVNF